MQNSTSSNTSNPDTATMRPRRRYLKWVALAAAILAIIAAALPVAALKYGESQSFGKMTPETRAAFEKWYTQKLTIPAEAIALKPFDSEVIKALEDFQHQWNLHKAAVLALDESWPCSVTDAPADDFVEQHLDKPAQFRPLLTAFKKVVAQPGYSADLWMSPAAASGSPLDPLLAMRASIRLLYMDSIAHLRAGDTDAAIASAEALLQTAHHHPYDSIIIQAISNAPLNMGLYAYQNILASSSDPAARSRIAADLSSYRDVLPTVSDEIHPFTIDHIGMTCDARRAGLNPQFNNKTGFEVMREAMHMRQKYYETVALPAATTTDEMKAAEAEIVTCKGQVSMLDPQHSGWRKVFGKKFDRINAAAIFALTAPALERTTKSKKAIVDRYDELISSLTANLQ